MLNLRLLPYLTFAVALGAVAPRATQATALQFAGDGDQVTVPLPTLFNNIAGNDFTFTGRVRPDAFATSRVFYAQFDTQNFATVLLGSGGTLVFYVVANGTTHSVQSAALTLGQWAHFGARWDAASSQVTLIVDGVTATAGGGTSSTGTNAVFKLGARSDGAQPINAALDEFTLWPVALSDAQIGLDASGACLDGVAQVLSYDFEVGTPGGSNAGLTTLPDVSGQGVDGTLSGFALTGATSNWVASPYAGCTHADLAISLGAAPNPVTAGDQVTWTASVVNPGPPDAVNVSVNGEVPAAAAFVALTPPAGFSCTAPTVGNSGPVVCSIADAPAGSYDFVLVTTARADATPNSDVSANWTVTSTGDPNAANDSASASTTIANQLNLQPDSASTSFGQAVDIDVLGNDGVAAGGAPLDSATLAVNTQAAFGTAACANSGCNYTPAPAFAGIDTFVYQVCDSSAAPVCGTAAVRIAVGPHAVGNSFATVQDQALAATVAGNDVFPANSTFAKVSGPAAGSVALAADGSFVYTPNAGYVGGDTFTYRVCLPAPDGGVCDFAIVELTVLAPNDRIFFDGFGV